METERKYAKVEWERRFLLDHLPSGENIVRVRHITDRYIEGTALRLREQTDRVTHGAQQGLITSIYLTEDEFRLFARLPSKVLNKTRYSVPPFGIDVFEGTLEGLVLAEIEFSSAPDADADLTLPSFILHEVTNDKRFTGGELAKASGQDLGNWLADYRILLSRE